VVCSASVWLIRIHRAFFVPRICSVPIWHSYVYVSLATWRQSGCCCESGNQSVFGALVCNLRICTCETDRWGNEFRGRKLQRGGRQLGLISDAICVWKVVDVHSYADTGVGISEVANFKRQVTRLSAFGRGGTRCKLEESEYHSVGGACSQRAWHCERASIG